ncbi:hypothetical protein NC981_21195 [Leptolyngbya sp. DQ-M1]|uniref:hypothetical protein n=1 Tax=Leptolyngbya sp. DQ-M1 TaxID=2933920 RepID=UPI003299E8CF
MGCDEILKQGVFNQVIINANKSVEENLYDWLTSVSYGEFKQKQDAGLKVGFPIEGIPYEVGGSWSEDKFNEWRQAVIGERSRKFKSNEFMQIVSLNASDTIVNAWLACMVPGGAGLKGSLEVVNEPDIIFTANWTPNSMTDYPPKVKPGGFIVSGATVVGGNLEEGMEIPLSGHKVLLRRDGHSGVTVILNTIGEDAQGHAYQGGIPAIPPIPPMPPLNLHVFTHHEGHQRNYPVASFTVPDGYKIISGGAKVNWNGYGNLLTASFPDNRTTWVAKAKDHGTADPATITIRVIALYDPNNEWEVEIESEPSGPEHHPGSVATLLSEYILTGGGAQAHWTTEGSLLTASCPQGSQSWKASSKDHEYPEAVLITAYAIGIRPRNGAQNPEMKIFPKTSPAEQHPSVDVPVEPGYTLVGGGAQVNWTGHGNLLTASYPSEDGTAWQVSSKDHINASPATITGYAIGVKV